MILHHAIVTPADVRTNLPTVKLNLPYSKINLLSGKMILPDGKTILPDEKTVMLSVKMLLPGGKIILPGGKTIFPKGKKATTTVKQYREINNILNSNNIKNIVNEKVMQPQLIGMRSAMITN